MSRHIDLTEAKRLIEHRALDLAHDVLHERMTDSQALWFLDLMIEYVEEYRQVPCDRFAIHFLYVRARYPWYDRALQRAYTEV